MVYMSKRLNLVEEMWLFIFKVFKYLNKCGYKKYLCELNIMMWSNKRWFVNNFLKRFLFLFDFYFMGYGVKWILNLEMIYC